ncbi:hydroxymethylbilane synthase [Nocardia sp. NPDC055029]|uniref:hydroxymethylbilane synthase n=1 Tax=Nocardia sp. NPDC060259 TaxID=3347088 RepID=UPI00365962D6
MITTVQEEDTVTAGSSSAPWRIGTRGSLLALTQAGTIRDALIAAGQPAELVVIKTPGDLSSDPVQKIGVGVFTSALRDELAAGGIDIAVHSYKDLPTAQDPRFTIAAIPPREDPRDALVARDGLVLGELPAGAKVGTSAPRRAAQLRALGLGLDIVPLRGNIDSRLRKVSEGELDAIVIARAGLARIGRTDAITESLEPVQMLPAPSQGALAVECRSDDPQLIEILAGLDDAPTRAAVLAERSLLGELEAGCTAPIGAIAEVVESIDEDGRIFEELSLRACAAAIDGSDVLRASIVGAPRDAEELGRALARDLLDLGARALLSVADEPEPEVGSPTQAVNTPAPDFTNSSPMENNR